MLLFNPILPAATYKVNNHGNFITESKQFGTYTDFIAVLGHNKNTVTETFTELEEQIKTSVKQSACGSQEQDTSATGWHLVDLHESCERCINNIVTFINPHSIRWLGHIYRIEMTTNTRAIKEWKALESRPRGRPRKQCMEYAEENIKICEL